jgi:hypothetical protein
MLIIRTAAVSDLPLLLRFSREFAEYERQPVSRSETCEKAGSFLLMRRRLGSVVLGE